MLGYVILLFVLLDKIKWWDWPLELISERYDDFKDVDTFIEKYLKEDCS